MILVGGGMIKIGMNFKSIHIVVGRPLYVVGKMTQLVTLHMM